MPADPASASAPASAPAAASARARASAHTPTRFPTLPAALVATLILAAALATATAYWPGIMTWDAIRQYGQALDGQYDDWHPPAMEWLWRQLGAVAPGPAPMLVLQLGLYWSGFAAVAARALADRRAGLALALTACGLAPFALALMGAVLKDCLMAGALLAATGLLMWRGRVTATLAIVLLLCAATLRFNAFLACLPLFAALLPPATRRGPLRLAVTSIVATAALMAAMPLANRLIGAEKSGVELSLVIFDLGGITERSGVNVFPPLGVADPVAVNHRCYSPVKWDPYSFWVDPPCPLGFEPMRAALKASGASMYGLWLGAIARHPLAYAGHRLTHFNINLRFLIPDTVALASGMEERPVQPASAPNPWHIEVAFNPLLSTLDRAALTMARTPLGWPVVWLALALGALIAAPGLRSRHLIVPIALSALLYGLGYAVFSVAAELRYHLWTMSGAFIACVLVAGDVLALPRGKRPRLGWAVAPVVVVTVLAGAWRVMA